MTDSHATLDLDDDFDTVDDVADSILGLARPLLLVFDCDGVLAPLVDHADNSVLNPGVGDHLARLSDADETVVAILSGRSLDGLDQFDFAVSILVAGSYGAERRGGDIAPISTVEQHLLDELDTIAVEATEAAGKGAWVERKPTSVVIHVREADPERGRVALALAWDRQSRLTGHESHVGSNVLEFMARPTDKGRGLDLLRSEVAPGATVYVGDDVPDEDAFAVLENGDLSIRVGPGPTTATCRLADAAAINDLLHTLASRMAPGHGVDGV